MFTSDEESDITGDENGSSLNQINTFSTSRTQTPTQTPKRKQKRKVKEANENSPGGSRKKPRRGGPCGGPSGIPGLGPDGNNSRLGQNSLSSISHPATTSTPRAQPSPSQNPARQDRRDLGGYSGNVKGELIELLKERDSTIQTNEEIMEMQKAEAATFQFDLQEKNQQIERLKTEIRNLENNKNLETNSINMNSLPGPSSAGPLAIRSSSVEACAGDLVPKPSTSLLTLNLSPPQPTDTLEMILERLPNLTPGTMKVLEKDFSPFGDIILSDWITDISDWFKNGHGNFKGGASIPFRDAKVFQAILQHYDEYIRK